MYAVNPSQATADDPFDLSERHFTFSYGFSFNVIGAISTNPNAGYKTRQAFTTENAFLLFVPFNVKQTTGFGVEIGTTAITYTMQQTTNPDSIYPVNNETYNYTSIFPHFYFNGLVVGAVIGLSPTSPTTGSPLKTAIIPRVGASIPITDESWGRLNFNFLLGYAFDGVYEKGSDYRYNFTPNVNDPSPRPITLSLGITLLMRAPIFY